MKNNFYKEHSIAIRKDVLTMAFKSQVSHIGSALSCVDILTVLYFKILKINPKNPGAENRDRFILSKGHAVSALYATLAERGFFAKKILNKYCKNGGRLPGHATRSCVPGIEVSTGSLGHGLAIGAGIALAGKVDNKKYRVFVLMSDGECDEGSVWESALFASMHKLDNLVAIIDYNKLQALGRTNNVLNLEPFKEKWVAFGWGSKEINGHNFKEIEEILYKTPFEEGKPSIVIAHTIKGKGISFMENKLEWHYRAPDKQQLKVALRELSTK